VSDRAHDVGTLALPDGRAVAVCLPDVPDPIAHEVRTGVHALAPPARLVLDLLHARPGARLLDLGAHIGTVALAAAACGAQVMAVEASPRNAAALEASIRRNRFSGVLVRNVAVGDRRGTVRFHEEGPYGRVVDAAAPEAVDVPMLAAADILAERGWDRVDVVKIDVEGYELQVLDGLRPLLTGEDRPAVVFEANRHVLAPRGVEPTDVVAAFAAAGYDTYLIGDGVLYPAARVMFQPETVADYLAVAPGHEAPWPVREPRTDDELATRVAEEASSPVVAERAALAAALATAPRALLAAGNVERALETLVLDPHPSVAHAAAWWPAWRQARAARGGPQKVVVDGWRALAQSARALTARRP
jgi:FkbM family methyltransferase